MKFACRLSHGDQCTIAIDLWKLYRVLSVGMLQIFQHAQGECRENVLTS